MTRRVHVLTLLLGLACLAVALGAMLTAYGIAINWNAVAIGAPVVLIVAGALGMASSRNKNS